MPVVFCEKLQSVKLHLYSIGIDTVSKPLQLLHFLLILTFNINMVILLTSSLEFYYHIRNLNQGCASVVVQAAIDGF